MDTIKATVTNGRIDLPAPPDWPDGCEVVIEPLPPTAEKVGLDEAEWRDDPAALADWEAWIKTIEPPEVTPAEAAANARFNDEMRRYNVKAARRQMRDGQ